MKIINTSIVYLVCFLSFSTTVLSQNKKIDSLKNELKIYTKRDTVRVKILNHLAYYNFRNNPSQSLAYAEQAGKLADEIKSIKGKARSFYMKGITHMELANFEVAIENYEKAIELYDSIDDLKGIAGCNNALGVLHKYRGNLKLAMGYHKKALEIDQKLGIEKNVPSYLHNMGSIYSDTGKYEEALINFKKALKKYTSSNNEYGMLSCWNSMAIVYQEQGNYPLAIEYNNKSLEIAKNSNDAIGVFQALNNIGNVYRQQEFYDKALGFYNEALGIQQANQNIKNITAIKNNMGGIYLDKGEFTRAIPYFNEVIILSRKIKDNEHLAISLNGIGYAYLGLKKYSEALTSFQEANKITYVSQMQYELIESYMGIAQVYFDTKKYDLALVNTKKGAQLAKKYKLLIFQRNAYALLYKINNKLEKHENAYINHKKFKTLNDSLFNRDSLQKITEIEYEYKYKNELASAEKRELRLTQTVKTTTNDLEKSQRNSFIAIIIILLISIISGSIIFFLKLRHVNAKNQNILIEQKLLRSQMTPHFIFNSLSVLQGMILDKKEETSISYLSKFSKLLRIILENSRHKIVTLSAELEAIDNYMALQNLDANPPYEYKLSVDAVINPNLFKIPPMLIQPFIENAIEHAFVHQKENREIIVQLTFKEKKLICTIADNGIGIDTNFKISGKNKNSLATVITSERLAMLSKDFKVKGSIAIENKKVFGEQGTLVTLVIPYKIESV